MTDDQDTRTPHGTSASKKVASTVRWRKAAVRLILLGTSCIVGLLIAEVGLRICVDVTDLRLDFWDPVTGPRHAPNQKGRYVRGAHINAPYHFNAFGWNHPRDYQTTKPPGTKRVCIVGDSYVEALQVPYEESFFGLAEERMSTLDRRRLSARRAGSPLRSCFEVVVRKSPRPSAASSIRPPRKTLILSAWTNGSMKLGREFLEPITRRLGIAYLDLAPALIAKVKETGKIHNFPDDDHYGPIGHSSRRAPASSLDSSGSFG